MQVNKSFVVAIAAIAVLGGAIGWRTIGQTSAENHLETIAQGDQSLFERLAAEAEADPSDSLKWQELGFALFTAEEFSRAADAYQKAVDADPDSAVLWAALGEAQVMGSETDPLPAAAVAAFEKAAALDSKEPRARYFLAVKKDLDKDHEGAIAAWLALLADTPPGAPWETNLVRTIQQVGAINQIEVEDRIAQASGTRNILPPEAMAAATQQQRGPTPEQVAAAGALSPTQQQEMAEGMVARLATRLESESDDVQGWLMLMRSYQQLGRTAEARRARDRAISANPAAKAQISDAAKTLGIQ